MWIGIPARVCARRPVRPRVARALFLDATVAPPVANACARCASIVVVVVVVDCRRRARLEGSASRRAGGHRAWANSQIARYGATVSYAQTVGTRGRSVAVGRRDRDGASTRATPHATTRDRDRDACLDAREPAARETTRRSVANRESRIARASRGTRARSARRLDSTPPRDARGTTRAGRRRVGEATIGAGEGSRGVVEGSRAASDSREAIARSAGPGDDGRARSFVLVHISTSRDSSHKGLRSARMRCRFGADSRAMAMRRVESMPELGEARASVSQETAHALRTAKNSDESTEDAFAMATSEAAGDDEDARAERDEATKTREATARARGDETTADERCFVDREPTVLIVDDCSMNLRIVSRVLAAIFSDVRVEFAHDGREGIKRYEELRNDVSCDLALIIVDYNMPWCDGVTASKYVRALEERHNSRAREQSDVAALWRRVPIVMYTTELHVILPALVDGTIDDRLPKVCTREMFSRSVVRHLAPRHARWVLPEWRGIESRAARFSCNDVANVELELDMRSRAFVSFDDAIQGKSVKKRHRQRDEEPPANGAKSLRGLDGEIIVLGSSSAEVSSDHNRGLLKRLSRSFNKLFKSKSSTLTARAKLKEDKRAALSKKFETTGASSLHTSLDNAFPRYSM